MNIKRAHKQHIIGRAALICILVCICFSTSEYARAADSAWDKFVPPPDDKFDWIQLTSGEWLKGELKFLYDFQVEFDSDKLDLLTFDLEDVKQIRTHKPQSIRIEDLSLSDDPIIVEGIVNLNDNKVIMTVGDGTREFERSQIISIAQADKKKGKGPLVSQHFPGGKYQGRQY
jgi:hypothetical protein